MAALQFSNSVNLGQALGQVRGSRGSQAVGDKIVGEDQALDRGFRRLQARLFDQPVPYGDVRADFFDGVSVGGRNGRGDVFMTSAV